MKPHKKGGQTGSRNGSARAVITPHGRFDTFKAASLHFGVSHTVMSKWIKIEKSNNFYYEKEIETPRVYKNLNKKYIKTPDGIFYGLNETSKFYGVCGESIRQRISVMKWEGWEYVS